jgi:hypothetical protein
MFRIQRSRKQILTYGVTGIGLVTLLVASLTLHSAGTPQAAQALGGSQLSHTTGGSTASGQDQRNRVGPFVTGTTSARKSSPGRHEAAGGVSSFNRSTAGDSQASAAASGGTGTQASVSPTTTVPTTTVPKPPVSSCTKQYQYTGTSLTGFITAGEDAHGNTECLSSLGESLSTGAIARISKPVALNFEGARVTGTSSLTSAMLSINAASSISRVTLDQGSGSSDGIDCNAACAITASTVEGMRGNGISVSGAVSDGSVVGGTSAATEVTTVGTLLSGLMFYHDSNVRVGYYVSDNDSHNGAFFNTVSAPCSAVSITAVDLGQPSTTWALPKNDNGSGLELLGTGTVRGTGCSFQSVSDRGNGGYGIDLTSDSWNTFANVWITGEASGELNSGINVDTNSNDNSFPNATVSHEATAVDIGDNGVPGGEGEVGNDHNAFGSLNVSEDSYGSVSIVGGEDNTFARITGTDEGDDGTGSSFYVGLIQFQYQAASRTCDGGTEACPVIGNVVDSASFTGSPSFAKWDTAHYVVYADAGTSDNTVFLTSLSHATYVDAWCDDANGQNHFSLRS